MYTQSHPFYLSDDGQVGKRRRLLRWKEEGSEDECTLLLFSQTLQIDFELFPLFVHQTIKQPVYQDGCVCVCQFELM